MLHVINPMVKGDGLFTIAVTQLFLVVIVVCFLSLLAIGFIRQSSRASRKRFKRSLIDSVFCWLASASF